jgi:ubiquinone biosynthesis protein
MLISLFNTARRFDMEVQPSLVLLQKTLLNIEGLGRQMYPQLDLWTTAQPFLEKWLKDRYSPKSVFKQFKRHVPDWLEHLPQIPPLIFQALQSMQQPEPTPQTPPSHSNKSPRRFFSRIGAALAGIGIGLASPQFADTINQIPGGSLTLLGFGLLLLLLR